MVAQNSIDGTGGWGIRSQSAAVNEQYTRAYAFPSTAPKPSPKFLISQPSIPNDLSKVVADLKHGNPDQSGLYTAYAGCSYNIDLVLQDQTTPFNNKIKGNPETQYRQPVPNMKGDDLLPADDGTPLRPSAMLKKMSEAAKALAGNPDNAAQRADLIRMYNDLLRIFYISERRPLNSDEISRVEQYARIIDRLLLQGPVFPRPPPPQRDIINQDLLNQRDILNQDLLDQIGEPVEPVEPVEAVEAIEAVEAEPVAFGQFENQLRFIYDNEDQDDESKDLAAKDLVIQDQLQIQDQDDEVELVEVDDYKHNPPILGSLSSSSLGSSSSSSLGSSTSTNSSSLESLGSRYLGFRYLEPLGSLGSSISLGYLEPLGSSISLESLGSLGSSIAIGNFDVGESKNVMSADTYIDTKPEPKIDTPFAPSELEFAPSELEFTPAPQPVESKELDDDLLMFNALNLIKNRFNLKGAKKTDILSYIRNSSDPGVAKSFAELQEFARTQQPGNRSKGQELHMRNYLKANFTQAEQRGRPISKR